MEMKEIKTGEVFTIENTPSYPKLKIDGGYVDMRDDIVNRSGNCDDKDVELLTCKKIAETFEDDLKSIEEWVKEKKEKYSLI